MCLCGSACKHIVRYDFDMFARDDFVVFLLQGIIEICCLKIKTCARMVLFDRDEGGGPIPAPLAWCKFTLRMDEGPESYANCRSQKGTDNPGGVVVVESSYF